VIVVSVAIDAIGPSDILHPCKLRFLSLRLIDDVAYLASFYSIDKDIACKTTQEGLGL
jgi:hypothetical protein